MLFDSSSSSFTGGGIALSVVVYGFVAAFATGPIIIDRSAVNSGWYQQCQKHVQSRILERAAQTKVHPNINCNALMGGLFGQQSSELCQLIDPFTDMVDRVNRQKAKVAEFNRQRLVARAKQAGSSCSCAVSMLIENKRIDVALYAASARLVTPPSIQNLNFELMSQLNTPLCSGGFK